MSTLKSSAENLTLNADGSGNDIKFQSNGVEKASLSDAGLLTTSGGASLDGAVTINETGADVDFRVESDTDANSLFVQGSDGMVGIGTGTPTYTLDVDSASANVARFKPIEGNRSLDITSADNGAYLGAVWTRDINSAGGTHIWSANGTEHMRIDETGAVTKPLQPAFQAAPASNNATNTDIPVATGVTVVFNENWDVGSNFASNTFTAPVTGRYSLSAHIRLNNMDAAAAYYAVSITTSNATYNNLIDPDFGQDTPQWHFHQTILADMDASDTATCVVYQHTGTQQTDIEHTMSIFSGYLLG